MQSEQEHWSYKKHEAHEAIMADKRNLPSSYTAPDQVDAWRHNRMHGMFAPLLKLYPKSIWMTVGDGRFGSDAHYLRSKGMDVLATSLTDESLKQAHDRGYIDKFARMNAEKIDLANDRMDFVYCKEAYHHFPKPPVAFYEMLRVSSKGVVLIEPFEQRPRPLGFIKAVAKQKLWHQPLHFEPAGNFIYRTDPNAIFKLMCADGHEGALAFKLFNDFYHPRLAKGRASKNSMPFFLQKLALGIMNTLCRLKLMDYGLICLVALRDKPSEQAGKELARAGFKIIELPKNPYKN